MRRHFRSRWLWSNWLLLFLLSVCVTRLWLMPLPSGFWTDETGTAFVVQRPADPSLGVVPQVPASIYYALPRASVRLFGGSEAAYRLPSVLTMGIAFFIIGRLAARLIDPGAAWFTVFVSFAMSDFNYYADDARPYALGICVAAAALYFLVEWFDTAGWRPALLFLLFAAILWRVQLVFWAFYPVFLIYALVRLTRSTTSASANVGWPRVLMIFFLLALALIPVAVQALGIFRDAKAHVIAPVPRFRSLIRSVAWKPIVFCGASAWLCGRAFKWRIQRTASRGAVTLIAVWWLWMPLCLWAFSLAAGTVLFVPRYFSPALPGAALAATAAVASFVPRAHWRQASLIMAAAALIGVGHWTVLWPEHGADYWRQGASKANRAALDPDTPVIAISPFIEAQPPNWSPEYLLPGFLYAPLFVYPVRGRVYPFPFSVSPDTEQDSVRFLRDILPDRNRFIVYGQGRNTMLWTRWFAGRAELAGWHYRVESAGDIHTVVFETGVSSGLLEGGGETDSLTVAARQHTDYEEP